MGSDSLADLVHWREPGRICELSTPLVVHRSGAPPPDFEPLASLVGPERIAAMRQFIVDMPQIELSSSEIRRRAALCRSIRYQTPRAVETYIQTHQLYRPAPASAPKPGTTR
jgi:nicotinate-nucleotide adenylyltransferase